MMVQQQFESGRLHHQAGRLAEAEKIYREILAREPDHAEALHSLGVLAVQSGHPATGVELIRRAAGICPANAVYQCNLGNALTEIEQMEEAIICYREAVSLRSDSAEVYYNLGVALQRNGQLEEAIDSYRQAVRIDPDSAQAHYNLGIALKDMRRLDEAIESYRQVIRLKPDHARTHNNLALALLTRGDFEEGWEEHEWRWKCQDFPSPRRNFSQPQWDGCLFKDRTLLVHIEQGFGDAIQFIRYLPMVTERGGKVVVECDAELQRLFRTVVGEFEIIVSGDPLPAFDFHTPLLSLPRVFGTNLASIPGKVPYVNANAEDAERWKQRLAEYSQFFKVGLAWAGSAAHKNDRNRSMTLATLAPLSQAAGVRFFSLQKGKAAEENKHRLAGMEVVDWTDDLKDFSDTAALIANLDLVISVDTVVAHLAGAVGKAVWTLLPFASDWRWLVGREDSPWYPTMRLFRQEPIGDWGGVVRRVSEALEGAR
jgi:Flp pilus assembly protein TadD